MTIPEIEKHIIEMSLKQYCANKVPDAVKDEVQIKYKIRGNSITLFELRPAFMKPDTWVDIPVAQFRYSVDGKNWTLYCADRNSRWHAYLDIDSTTNFDDLLDEVESDPTGIFWG